MRNVSAKASAHDCKLTRRATASYGARTLGWLIVIAATKPPPPPQTLPRSSSLPIGPQDKSTSPAGQPAGQGLSEPLGWQRGRVSAAKVVYLLVEFLSRCATGAELGEETRARGSRLVCIDPNLVYFGSRQDGRHFCKSRLDDDHDNIGPAGQRLLLSPTWSLLLLLLLRKPPAR